MESRRKLTTPNVGKQGTPKTLSSTRAAGVKNCNSSSPKISPGSARRSAGHTGAAKESVGVGVGVTQRHSGINTTVSANRKGSVAGKNSLSSTVNTGATSRTSCATKDSSRSVESNGLAPKSYATCNVPEKKDSSSLAPQHLATTSSREKSSGSVSTHTRCSGNTSRSAGSTSPRSSVNSSRSSGNTSLRSSGPKTRNRGSVSATSTGSAVDPSCNQKGARLTPGSADTKRGTPRSAVASDTTRRESGQILVGTETKRVTRRSAGAPSTTKRGSSTSPRSVDTTYLAPRSAGAPSTTRRGSSTSPRSVDTTYLAPRSAGAPSTTRRGSGPSPRSADTKHVTPRSTSAISTTRRGAGPTRGSADPTSETLRSAGVPSTTRRGSGPSPRSTVSATQTTSGATARSSNTTNTASKSPCVTPESVGACSAAPENISAGRTTESPCVIPRNACITQRGATVGCKRNEPIGAEVHGETRRKDNKENSRSTRGKRPDASTNPALKEVEFKLDIGKRRLPSPDVRRSQEKERAPEFVVKPRRQFVDEGQSAKFKVSFEGSPATKLSWSRDGKPLQNGSKYKMSEEGGYHYLEVCDVTADDSGIFVGTVENSTGTDTASAELDVFEHPKLLSRGPPTPTLSTSLRDLDVVIGDRDVKLQCDVTEGDDCTVTWYHNGKEIRPGRKYRCRFLAGKTASLVITEIGEDDGGLYECVIANSNGEIKTSCTLSTQEGEKFEPPVFIQELQDMEVDDGDTVELNVEVKGSQPIHVYWLHDNNQVTVDTPGCVLQAADGVHSLAIPRASAESVGEYVCEAYNDYGDTDTFCRIQVKEVVDNPSPPDFLTRPKLVTVTEGCPATFTCRVNGHPLPKVTWERNGGQLSNNQKYKISSECDRHSLEVLSAYYTDAGHYICHVRNQAGCVSHTCSLVVKPENANAAATGAPVNFRALLKPSRQRAEETGSKSSTDSERPDKENESRGFRNVLKNNRQPTTSSLLPTISATATYTSTRLSRDANKPSSTRATATNDSSSAKPGAVKRNLDLFQHRPSASPERPSTVALRSSASPRDSPSQQRRTFSPAAERRSYSPLVERRTDSPVRERAFSPAQERRSFSPLVERRTDSPVGERAFSPAQERTSFSPAVERRKDCLVKELTHSPAQERRSLSPFVERRTDSPVRERTFSPGQERRSFSPAVERRTDSPARDSRRFNLTDDTVRPSSLHDRSRNISQSPVEETFRASPVQARRQTPEHEPAVFKLRARHEAVPGLSNDRYHGDASPFSTQRDSVKSDLKPDSSKSDTRTDPPKSDFRSVLSKVNSVDKNGNNKFSTHTTTAESKPSWLRKDPTTEEKKNGHGKELKTTDTSKTDFRSVLKNRQAVNNTKPAGITKDTKAHVQSQSDFKSVFAKVKHVGEDKKNGVSSNSSGVVGKLSSDKPVLVKDVNSIKSKFEAPAADFRSVQLKQPKSQTDLSVRTDTDTTRKPADWRTRRNRDVVTNTTSAPSKPEPTTSTSNDKQSAIYISVADPSKYSDTHKDSESSQWSDSAISSAFSKLSELSDFSDSSSPRSDISLPVEAPELRSRRRLERLRGEHSIGNGGGGSGGGGSLLAKKTEELSEAPSIEEPLSDQHVTYGGQAVFQCKVTGVPDPKVKWSLNNKAIKPSKFFQLSYCARVAQLVVSEAFSEDEGEYTCTVSNPAGTDSCSCFLTVEASSCHSSRSGSHAFEGPVSIPPRVQSLTPQNLTVERGQPARLDLTFIGEPAPKVKWFLSKTELTADGHFSMASGCSSASLSIKDADTNDSGRYTVTITNDLGTDLKAAEVTVGVVPEPPMGRPHVYDVSRQSVSLSWCGPAYDGGCMITHYAIEVKDNVTDRWTTLAPDCQSTSYHALNLTQDRTYEFRVRAGNGLGLGQPSEASEPVTMQDPLQSSEDYESDDELPFEPRDVKIAPGRKFEDHYEYLHQVGKGKFGNVYKCRDKATGKVWAAKVLKVREKDKGDVRREVEVMNQLAHPKLLMLWDAFEAPRSMVLVIEFVGAGELFERVIRDDFVLTERDCVHFIRQICSGVGYMHSKQILHLDLKPENVLCVAENTNQVKIIDFGLARFFKPGDSLQVLFGTPEFIAPEVINYDEIGHSTDLWSIGVICYILLSGLSPFLGDSEAETLANVTSVDYDFDDDSFEDISDNAKDFIGNLLVKRKEKRLTIEQCEQHSWLAQEDHRTHCKRLNTDRLRCFMARRKWQKAGNAFRALGRMASLQKMLTGGSTGHSSASSLSSIPNTPTPIPSTPEGQSQSRLADSGQSTPVQSLSHRESDSVSSSSPFSAACDHQGVEDKGDDAPATTTTTTAAATATDVGLGSRVPGDGRVAGEAEKDGARFLPGRTGARGAAATTTPAGQSSPSARRRVWEDDSPVDTAPSIARGSRFKPIKTDTAKADDQAHGCSTDPAQHDVNTTTTTTSSSRHLPRAANTTNTTKTTSNGFSPSRAPPPLTNGGGDKAAKTDGSLAPAPPSFVKEMVDCSAFPGDVVRFDVRVTGQPAPKLHWSLEEDEVEADARHIVELGENGLCSLIVRHVTEDDEGEYSCRAVNSQGEAMCSAELSVYGIGPV